MRALRRVGCDVEAADELPRWGFQVCHRDLEDELMRDLGETRHPRGAVEASGLTQRFAMLTQQPAWCPGSFHEQVHRFAGAASGRKELMAAALAEALDVDALAGAAAPACSRPSPSRGRPSSQLRSAAPTATHARHSVAEAGRTVDP